MTPEQELIQLNDYIQRLKAKKTFWVFCLYYDFEFFSKRLFLKRVADAFQDIYEGKINKLAVSMPPRAGKSYITSLFCAWLLGNKPDGSVMRNTCTSTLYEKFSYDVRAVLKTEKFKAVFTGVALSRDKAALKNWNTNQARQVSYFGGGVGGTIIGFGATEAAITDDLYSGMKDALSPTVNYSTHMWRDSEHNSRLEKGCPTIDIGTRWSKKDIIGKMEQDGRYDVIIRIPALIDGKSFCEDVKTTEEYLDKKASTDKVIWEAEYMQMPIEVEGLLFPITQLRTYKSEDLSKNTITNIGVTDVADSGEDYLCSLNADVRGENVYITDVIFTKESIEITENTCAAFLKDNKQSEHVFESNNGGKAFAMNVQKLHHKIGGFTGINWWHTSSNKESRILINSGAIKRHFIFRSDYETNSDYAKFMQNLTEYTRVGKNKNDDAPDACTLLVEMIRRMKLLDV